MPVGNYARKVATCCYCGTRATLVLDETRHELACSSCGAPLHDFKMLPKSVEREAAPAAAPSRPTPQKPRKYAAYHSRKKTEKRSKRKGLWQKIIEEVWDEIEDIFD